MASFRMPDGRCQPVSDNTQGVPPKPNWRKAWLLTSMAARAAVRHCPSCAAGASPVGAIQQRSSPLCTGLPANHGDRINHHAEFPGQLLKRGFQQTAVDACGVKEGVQRAFMTSGQVNGEHPPVCVAFKYCGQITAGLSGLNVLFFRHCRRGGGRRRFLLCGSRAGRDAVNMMFRMWAWCLCVGYWFSSPFLRCRVSQRGRGLCLHPVVTCNCRRQSNSGDKATHQCPPEAIFPGGMFSFSGIFGIQAGINR